MSTYDDLKAALAVYLEASEHHARLPYGNQTAHSRVVESAYRQYQDVKDRVYAEWQ